MDVPCCSVVAEQIRDDLVEKLNSEEMVLKTFLSDRTMVSLSLDRIYSLPSVSVDKLFETNIFRNFLNLCRKSPKFQDQDLPHLIDVSDEETVKSTSSRSVQSLFNGQIP